MEGEGEFGQAAASLDPQPAFENFVLALKQSDPFVEPGVVLDAAHHHPAELEGHFLGLLEEVQLDLNPIAGLNLHLLRPLADVVVQVLYLLEDGLVVGLQVCQPERPAVL